MSDNIKYCSTVVLFPQSSVAVQMRMMVHKQPPDMHIDSTVYVTPLQSSCAVKGK